MPDLEAPIDDANLTESFAGFRCFLIPPALLRDCVANEGCTRSTWFLACREAVYKIAVATHSIAIADIPPAITKPKEKADDTSMEVESQSTKSDDDMEDEDHDDIWLGGKHVCQDAKDYYFSFLQFLWLAYKDKIPSVPVNIAMDKVRKDWFNSLKKAITPPNAHQPQASICTPYAAGNQPNGSYDDLVTALKEGFTKQSGKSKPHCFENLPLTHRQALLCLCSEDGLTLPAKMPPKALEFLAHPDANHAMQELQLDLYNNYGCSAAITGFVTTVLWKGWLLWTTPDAPSGGFSAFYLARRPPSDSLFSNKDFERSVRMSSGAHFTDSEVKDFMRKTFYHPSTVDDAQHMLLNYRIVCQFFFGNRSLLATKLTSWINHILLNNHVYCSMQLSDKNFATEFVYCVDLRVQQVVLSCYRSGGSMANCDFSFINDFGQIQNDIVSRRFSIRLPEILKQMAFVNTATTNGGTEETPATKKSKRKQSGRSKADEPKTQKSRNVSNPDRSLCIEESEVFTEVFPRGKILYGDLPLFNGKDGCYCCLHWHAKGSCRETGCPHACSHGTANADTKAKFKAFLAKQRKVNAQK